MRYWAALQDCLYRQQAVAELNELSGHSLDAKQWYTLLNGAMDQVTAPR